MTATPRTCGRCRTKLEPRRIICGACGKRNVKRKQKHMRALQQPDEAFTAANDGLTVCWICNELGTRHKGWDSPHRDHWHTGPNAGEPRGKLCPHHNMLLGPRYTPELVGAYHRYLTRRRAA